MSDLLPSGHRRINHVEMRGITIRFPGVLANDNVSFDVRSGEIHALLGENGAGKSTLMKILYGMQRPQAGQILIDGGLVTFNSPKDALQRAIGMIHQHFMLVPALSVAENVALGISGNGLRLDLDAVRQKIVHLSEIYGLKVNPNAFVWQLSVGEQQRVEIIKALYHGGALLILDEPTAVLTPQEVSELFVTLRALREQGHALIFISHKLGEVQALSDRITVMRDGRVVETTVNDNVDRRRLARMMVGRDVQFQPDRPVVPVGETRLQLVDVVAKNDQGLTALNGLSLEVHGGEIVGIAGVSGNGQRELAETIAGLRPLVSGDIQVRGKSIARLRVAQRLDAGIAYIPEERMKHGTIGAFTVAENAILQMHGKPPYSRGTLMHFRTIKRHAEDLIERFNIKTPSASTAIKNLSGGNIQKLILARELSRKPDVLIAAQPTRGVDISATEYIHQVLIEQRGTGTAILLISEDLDEIMALSDRIAVIYEGRIVRVFEHDQADVETIGLLMAGIKETA